MIPNILSRGGGRGDWGSGKKCGVRGGGGGGERKRQNKNRTNEPDENKNLHAEKLYQKSVNGNY